MCGSGASFSRGSDADSFQPLPGYFSYGGGRPRGKRNWL
jgi:hypothetical protein